MILKYKDFKLINEDYIYYAIDLLNILSKIKEDPIANDMISTHRKNVEGNDKTYIGLDRTGYFSYATTDNMRKNFKSHFNNNSSKIWIDEMESGRATERDVSLIINDEEYGKKYRNIIKLGRFVNSLFPNKYNSKQIEEFTNKFKATLDQFGETFSIVEGDEIKKWYLEDNYYDDSGQLGSSCMRYEECQDYFDIYTENPDVCKMLILTKEDKLLARAILWKIDSYEKIDGPSLPKFEWFMDRQYSISDHYTVKLRQHAKKQGWAYKYYNSHSKSKQIAVNGKVANYDMTVNLDFDEFSKFPYIDTFQRLDPSTGILYNDCDENSSTDGHYLLTRTDGNWDTFEIEMVWSDYHNRDIPQDYAVWSDYHNSYLDEDKSVYIESLGYGQTGWYSKDSDMIVFVEYKGKSYHIDDTVQSHDLETILIQDAVNVITHINSDGTVEVSDDFYNRKGDDVAQIDTDLCIYRELEYIDNNWVTCGWILYNLIVINYMGDVIPKAYSIYVYKADKNEFGDFLSEMDAKLLGVSINKGHKLLTDIYEYYKDFVNGELYDKFESLFKYNKDLISGLGQKRIKYKEEEFNISKEDIEKNIEYLNKRLELFKDIF